jgi:outer membrane receptor protein involved in Fe transport
MLKKITINLAFIIISQIAFTQNAIIKGTVKDSKTGESLVGVNIVANSDKGTVSDIDGKFSLELEPGEYKIQISYLGYETVIQKVILVAGETKTIDYALKESAKELDIVTVSGSKYERKLSEETVSIEVLKSGLLQNSNIITLNEGMDKVAGVVIVDTIRGGSGYSFGVGSRVQLMIDDMPILSIDRGEIRWNFVPMELIDQVEVLKSASSALYGASALNGVVNVRTGFAKNKPETEALVYTQFYDSPRRDSLNWWANDENSFNNPIRYGGQISHKQRFGQHDVALAFNYNKTIGFIRLLDIGHRRMTLKYRFRAKKVDGLTTGISANFMDSEEADFFFWNGYENNAYIPYGSSGPDSRGTISAQKRRTIMIDPWVVYNDKFGNRHTLRNRIYYANLMFSVDNPKAYQMFSEYQFHRSFLFGLSVTAGIIGQFTKLDNPAELGVRKNNTFAGYFQLDYKIKRFNFILGGRYEHYKLDTLSVWVANTIKINSKKILLPLATFGINYQAGRATWIRGNISQGYRIPSLAERFADETLTGAIGVVPNVDLLPEYGFNAELGVKQGLKINSWLGYADLSIFWMEYWNMIEYVFDFVNSRLGFQAQNISRARIAGYELSLIGQGKIWKIPVRIQSGYTYNYGADLNQDTTLVNAGKFTKYFFHSIATKYEKQETGNDSLVSAAMLKYRFRHLIKCDIEFDVWNFTIGTEVRYYSHVEKVDPIFALYIPELDYYRKLNNKGSVVYNQRISYDFKKFGKLSLIVNNVGNREYSIRPARMEPPRNFTIQYRISI